MLKADKNGSVLSTAAFMEVLEDNGDMQVIGMLANQSQYLHALSKLLSSLFGGMQCITTSRRSCVLPANHVVGLLLWIAV